MKTAYLLKVGNCNYSLILSTLWKYFHVDRGYSLKHTKIAVMRRGQVSCQCGLDHVNLYQIQIIHVHIKIP